MCARGAVPAVYPYPGAQSWLQCPGQGICRIPADGGSAREAGILHGHYENAAAGADEWLRQQQEPQAHAAQVSQELLGPVA